MFQLDNRTPFKAELSLLNNEQGIETLYTVVKATFNISDWTLADEQVDPLSADEYWGEPGESSLKYSSDIGLAKPATDIAIVGRAMTQDNRDVESLDVTVKVGSLEKAIRVFGDRVWQGSLISRPEKFSSMPILYERAFGGKLQKSESEIETCESNPIGLGFVDEANCENQFLPNIENPIELITSPKDKPAPVGLGFIAPNWKPRCEMAGIYDETWEKNRAPFLPLDFNLQFLNASSSGLVYPEFIQGGEEVSISNMNPDGEVRFVLPEVKIKGEVMAGAKNFEQAFVVETIVIEPNEKRVMISWKASFSDDKFIHKVKEVSVSLLR